MIVTWTKHSRFSYECTMQNITAQAPIVQRAGIFIHWINPIQLIKINVFQRKRFIRWIATDPLDKVICSLNNRDQPDLSFGEFYVKQLSLIKNQNFKSWNSSKCLNEWNYTLMRLNTIYFLAANPDTLCTAFKRKSSLVSRTYIFQFHFGFGCSEVF